jgi:hypothetical protein
MGVGMSPFRVIAGRSSSCGQAPQIKQQGILSRSTLGAPRPGRPYPVQPLRHERHEARSARRSSRPCTTATQQFVWVFQINCPWVYQPYRDQGARSAQHATEGRPVNDAWPTPGADADPRQTCLCPPRHAVAWHAALQYLAARQPVHHFSLSCGVLTAPHAPHARAAAGRCCAGPLSSCWFGFLLFLSSWASCCCARVFCSASLCSSLLSATAAGGCCLQACLCPPRHAAA